MPWEGGRKKECNALMTAQEADREGKVAAVDRLSTTDSVFDSGPDTLALNASTRSAVIELLSQHQIVGSIFLA